jgi:hypothetical protein
MHAYRASLADNYNSGLELHHLLHGASILDVSVRVLHPAAEVNDVVRLVAVVHHHLDEAVVVISPLARMIAETVTMIVGTGTALAAQMIGEESFQELTASQLTEATGIVK